VLKHAGRAQAQVTLRQRADALEIDVMDDGHGPAPGSGMGEGLMGMRERVSMLGGELHAGPQPEGGYAVHVRLPVLDRVRT
jgi:signal transduction histidine kinase